MRIFHCKSESCSGAYHPHAGDKYMYLFDIEMNRLVFILLLMLKEQFIFHPYEQDFFFMEIQHSGENTTNNS